jgi:hypothetical protein
MGFESHRPNDFSAKATDPQPNAVAPLAPQRSWPIGAVGPAPYQEQAGLWGAGRLHCQSEFGQLIGEALPGHTHHA